MSTVKTNKTVSKIIAIIFVLITIGVAVYFIFFNNTDYTPLKDIDLSIYSLEDVQVQDLYILNDPNEISGTLIFKNAQGDTLKAKLSEATISGFSTKSIGTWQMNVQVGNINKTVDYVVSYKDLFYNNNTPIRLSIQNPFELDGIYAICTDYYDDVVKRRPLSEIFATSDFDVDYVTNYEQNARTTFQGFDIEVYYTVGYIGYNNYYCGTNTQIDNGTLYALSYFTMNVNEDEESGTGSFQIIYDNSSLLEPTTENLSFTWQKDYLQNILTLSLANRTNATYNYLEHHLVFDADAINTINPLTFTLKLDN